MLFIDFETYFDSEYSLREMTAAEYIRDSRFEMQLLCYAQDDEAVQIIRGDDSTAEAQLRGLNWNQPVCAHNAAFDLSVLWLRYGIRPLVRCCTMSMGRALYGMRSGASLKALATLAQKDGVAVPSKGTALFNMKGYRAAQFTPRMWSEFMDYCKLDVLICRALFRHYRNRLPVSEYRLIDWTVRAAAEPALALDVAMLENAANEADRKRSVAMGDAGVSVADVRDGEELAALLWQYGVQAPTKLSPATHKQIYAFSRADDAFMQLQQHADPHVRALVNARLNAMSNIDATRARRMAAIGRTGLMPFELFYYGAANTGRWSGTGAVNLQNLPRGSLLRKAICAPKGYKLCVGDLSQIELRVNMWDAGDEAALKTLREGGDLYSETAAHVFGHPVSKHANPIERFIGGKRPELSGGYGVGPARFQSALRQDARDMGIELPDDSLEFCQHVINAYRGKHPKIVALWQWAERLLVAMMTGDVHFDTGRVPIKVEHEAVMLPNGMRMHYPGLQREFCADKNRRSWTYQRWQRTRLVATPVYGGYMVENLTQALARIILGDMLLALDSKFRVVGSVHDELIMLVPDSSDEDAIVQEVRQLMSIAPAWAPDLPLDAEVGIGIRYGEIK